MKVGDRVFYKDNGPSDQGTIIGLTKNITRMYTVKFDDTERDGTVFEPDDDYTAEQLEPIEK